MLLERRLLRGVNAVLGGLAVAAIATLALIAHRIDQTERPPKIPPEQSQYRETVLAAHHALKLGHMEEAEADYLAALRLRPDSPHMLLEVADFYDDLGRDEEAISRYRRLIDPALKAHRVPTSLIAATVRYGDRLLTHGDETGARRAYEAVIERFHRSQTRTVSLMQTRSRAYLGMARVHDPHAREYLRRAVELDPGNWQGYGLEVVRLWWSDRPTTDSWFAQSSPTNGEQTEETSALLGDAALDRIAQRPEALAHLRKIMPSVTGVERDALARSIAWFEREAQGSAPSPR